MVVNFIEKRAPRDLDGADIFAGHMQFTRTMEAAGYKCEAFDLKRSYEDNILTKPGFERLLHIILRVRDWGIVLCGPPCSLWIFLSSNYHCRKKMAAEGDETKKEVLQANIVVQNLIVLLVICALRKAWVGWNLQN